MVTDSASGGTARDLNLRPPCSKVLIRLGTTRLTVGGTVFNVFNNNVVLATITRQNQTTANNVTTILAPRVAQFGVKFAF